MASKDADYTHPRMERCHKTAFLCSRKYPATAVLHIYDWAKAMRESGECVISGFHSRLERDVLDSLLKGSQPIILATHYGFTEELGYIINYDIKYRMGLGG